MMCPPVSSAEELLADRNASMAGGFTKSVMGGS